MEDVVAGRTLIETGTAGWYSDPQDDSDQKVRKRAGDLTISQQEYERLGSPPLDKMAAIKCVDCGEPRLVKRQDAFQVKRCQQHQKEHQRKQHARRARERRKQKQADAA
jgi:hypothetical protein